MIELKDICYKDILKNINLTIDFRDKIVLAGPNGSGKTLLSLIISGIIEPTSGEVILDGKNIKDMELKELRKKIGIVFQEPEMQFVTMSVEKEIEFGMQNLQFPKYEIDDTKEYILDRFSLKDIRNNSPFEISGGEKQIVALASIIAMKPSFIIFDEVTSFLDMKYKKMIYNFIWNYPGGFIWITQDFDEFVLGKTLIMLEKGKIVFTDDIEKMIKEEKLPTSEILIRKKIKEEGLERYL
uniref:ABC transporter ATP-binding protein n=1 Tax=candidate division WOR-3 bacterium TaxID=2052148 RepID=A0A7C4Y4X8_UNCW3